MLIQELFSSLRVRVVRIDHYCDDNSWSCKNLNSPGNRLYLTTAGEAYIWHHDHQYHLTPGTLHLIPCHISSDHYCPKYFEHYFLYFGSRTALGMDLFSLLECNYHIKADKQELALCDRLREINPDKVEQQSHLPLSKKLAVQKLTTFEPQELPRDILESDGIIRMLIAPFLETAHEHSNSQRIQAIHRFRDVLSYIDDNLCQPITLEELAHIVHLEQNYFSRLFAQFMGARPIQFINRRRIERAQLLLLSTDKSVNEIALEVGFCDWAYFCRTFKKYMNITPGEYRKTVVQ
ncbi:MAG: helix-turn-helix transcriptional regulator [Sedimentisphaerales bacterium]|nr:helix-turn-helix transcriptional regulator [Sedimentisphaerales bacterium]